MMPTQLQTDPLGSSSPDRLHWIRITQASLPEAAPILEPILRRSTELTSGRLFPDDVFRGVADGHMQLWAITEEDLRVLGLVVTEIMQYPAKRACLIFQLAGHDIRRWIHFLEDLEMWAKGQGCQMMEIQGRRGWAKLCPEYTEAFTVFEKELHDG